MRFCHRFFLAVLMFPFFSAFAQKTGKTVVEKCGTMQRLQLKLQQNDELRNKFEQQRSQFNQTISQRIAEQPLLRTQSTIYIPVVFHIVMKNPSLVTDAQVQAQLDTLNRDYSGANGDSVKIPSYFKPLFGKSSIQFCLAKRTPDGDPSTGIVRVTTSASSFGIDDAVKQTSTGGDDSWNTDNYFNVWICSLSNTILGYGTFPEDGFPKQQGVVIDYRSIPGGTYTNYNTGKTLTHETGHYFNLYHIWGDDDGSCTGTDYVADTPNQADATNGCPTGIKLDSCTSTGNGVMYQNYLDYSDDPCLVMFTKDQVTRMESALSTYRSSLFSSNGCKPVALNNYDVQMKAINQPGQRLCAASFVPAVTFRNRGTITLTSLQINARIDNGTVVSINWTGSLKSLDITTAVLNSMTTSTGAHVLTIWTSNPNGNADQDPTNDTIRLNFQYYLPVTTVKESFESTAFPPASWDVVNPDNGITWQRITGIAKTGNASVMMDNYDYSQLGQKDDLRMPLISIPAITDSAFLSFQLAAATYTDINTSGNIWDTLEVLASTDCGASYTSLYKKWGPNLVTSFTATTNPFSPLPNQWRKDSVNLVNYIGSNNLLIAFRSTNGYENNIYLDDINLRTVVINPNLKAQGLLITPNPTSGMIAVQFYPYPVKLNAIQIFNGLGQKIQEVNVAGGQASNYYNFNLSSYTSGTYYVRVVFNDRVIIKKVIKF